MPKPLARKYFFLSFLLIMATPNYHKKGTNYTKKGK